MNSILRSSLAVFTFLVLMGGDPALSEDWRNVKAQESAIIFYGPGLSNNHGIFATSGRSHQARWVGPSGDFPRAEFFYRALEPGYSFTAEQDLVKGTKFWGWLENKALNMSDVSTIWNGFGKTSYLTFNVRSHACISLQRYWGRSPLHQKSPRFGTKVLAGYYCRSSTKPFSPNQIKELVGAVGIRFDKLPAPPSGNWEEI